MYYILSLPSSKLKTEGHEVRQNATTCDRENHPKIRSTKAGLLTTPKATTHGKGRNILAYTMGTAQGREPQ